MTRHCRGAFPPRCLIAASGPRRRDALAFTRRLVSLAVFVWIGDGDDVPPRVNLLFPNLRAGIPPAGQSPDESRTSTTVFGSERRSRKAMPLLGSAATRRMT